MAGIVSKRLYLPACLRRFLDFVPHSLISKTETKLKFYMGALLELLNNSDDYLNMPLGRKRKILKSKIRGHLETVS